MQFLDFSLAQKSAKRFFKLFLSFILHTFAVLLTSSLSKEINIIIMSFKIISILVYDNLGICETTIYKCITLSNQNTNILKVFK